MALRPIGDKIIVKRKEVVKTDGGIILPDAFKEAMQATEGLVIATGDEVVYVKPQDKVYFGKYSGGKCERKKEEFLMMREEDVLAIIEGED